MINFSKQFQNDESDTFCVMWVQKLQIFQRMHGLISAFSTQKLCCFILNVTPKELSISPVIKFHKFFKCSESIRIQHDVLSTQSCILMRQNVNSVVNKDSPIMCKCLRFLLLCFRTNQSWKLFKIQKVSFFRISQAVCLNIPLFKEGFQ